MTIYDGSATTYASTGGVIRLKGYTDAYTVATPQYQAKFIAQRIH